MVGIRLGKRGKPRASTAAVAVDPDEVARVAYDIYQQRGCQAGRELDDWLEAEGIVRRRCAEKMMASLNNGKSI